MEAIMVSLSKARLTRALVYAAAWSFGTAIIHSVDDVIHDDLGGGGIEMFALTNAAVGALYIFSMMWSWAGKTYGHIVTGLVSLAIFYPVFLSHALALGGVRGLLELGQAAPAIWTPIFVGASLLGGVTSAVAVILAVYLTVWGRQSA